jgi:hypothetical protein
LYFLTYALGEVEFAGLPPQGRVLKTLKFAQLVRELSVFYGTKKFISDFQGRIKSFLGPMHFSSLGPLGDSKRIVATKVYSRLSGLMEAEGMHGLLRNTDNPNFIFYTPTAPLARRRL